MKGFESIENWQETVRADFAGTGEMKGRLYDLGDYPAVTKADGLVRGEVYELEDPEVALRILDEYEQFFPLQPERSLFVRTVAPVVMEDGRIERAWVYLYNGPVDENSLIPSGDYRDRVKAGPPAGQKIPGDS